MKHDVDVESRFIRNKTNRLVAEYDIDDNGVLGLHLCVLVMSAFLVLT